jgi:glycosyltransferase involved in cell wall biosynthesis
MVIDAQQKVTADVMLATSWVFPHLGGVSSHLSLLARQLGIAEKEVVSASHFIASEAKSWKRIANGLRKMSLKALKKETISLHARQLARLLAGARCEIVHCHDVMAAWAAVQARESSRSNFKIVATLHGPVSNVMVEEGHDPDSPDVAMVRRCERETWRQCDALIAVDTLQAEIAVEQGADRSKIALIRNAVDVAQIDQLAGSLPLAKDTDEKWILVPRRLAAKNGIEFAIRALGALPLKARLLIAGTGHEKENLERLVDQLGLRQQVVFLGGLSHAVLIPLMALSDLVVVPSVPIHGIVEATSLSAIEAMALARPVVASDIGGLKELITSGSNGMLVPPGDPAELAEVFSRLLMAPEDAKALGKQARKTVLEHFSVDLWFDRHLAVYQELSAG